MQVSINVVFLSITEVLAKVGGLSNRILSEYVYFHFGKSKFVIGTLNGLCTHVMKTEKANYDQSKRWLQPVKEPRDRGLKVLTFEVKSVRLFWYQLSIQALSCGDRSGLVDWASTSLKRSKC